jgi:iron complex outermembrane recepter protein
MFLIDSSRRTKCMVAALVILAIAPRSTRAQGQTSTASSQNPPMFQATVQVTATRFGEPVAEVPGSISVITGDEIRARGAIDLRTALALLGGVDVAPGGEAARPRIGLLHML